MDRTKPEKEKSSKGLSLRRKRTKDKKAKPIIGPPRQIPMPAMPGARVGQTAGPMNAPPPPQASRNLRDKEKVADMVKRRMSTRFTMLPEGDGDIPPMPNMPPMPAMPGGLPAALQAGAAGKTVAGIDMTPFRDPAFDPDKFISKVLENASTQQIEEYQRALAEARHRSQNDLQKNIYINRTQFVITAKEVDKVKSEMRSLRSNITDLRNTTNSLKTDNSYSNAANESAATKRSNRSSVADLTALHMSHLQALWKEVEGAQKFLPSVPGRHIVVESRNWIELNAATWKPRRIVHLVLLNDHILVATVKKKRTADNSQNSGRSNAPAQIKNVAEKCWPLSDIDMVDIDSSRKGVTNAISLRIGKETFVYQNEELTKKQELLRQFKKSSDELRKALRAENEDSMRRRDSVHFLTGRDPLLLEHGDLLNSLSTHGAGTSLFTVNGQTRNLRWVETELDTLDEAIAHRKFEDAVLGIVEMRAIANGLAKSNTVVSELINIKLDERASKLAGMITTDLVDESSHKMAVKQNVAWLKKLDYEDRAREAFLQARTTLIRKRIRQIQFEGDVSFYISQVALVQFTMIKNTAEIFNSCFDSSLSSALVRWAYGHVESYMELLKRQLEVVEPGSKSYTDCMEITKIHSTMLVDAGFDFKPLRKPTAYVNSKATKPPVGLGVQTTVEVRPVKG